MLLISCEREKMKNWHMVVIGVLLIIFAQTMWYLTGKGII